MIDCSDLDAIANTTQAGGYVFYRRGCRWFLGNIFNGKVVVVKKMAVDKLCGNLFIVDEIEWLKK